jgi:hypothetical protein
VSARFLTASRKAAVIAEWEAAKLDWRNGRLQGVGAPDQPMLAWCDKINALPGLCTLQSCAGHRRGSIYETAHLWLWMTREVAARFDEAAPRLARQTEEIDSVSKLFMRDGKEVASIYFYGDERDHLNLSVGVVYRFLSDISCKSPPVPCPSTRYQARQSWDAR